MIASSVSMLCQLVKTVKNCLEELTSCYHHALCCTECQKILPPQVQPVAAQASNSIALTHLHPWMRPSRSMSYPKLHSPYWIFLVFIDVINSCSSSTISFLSDTILPKSIALSRYPSLEFSGVQ